jgi:4-amino-4-deoxy-L-arabinose transferase-like glycosyltransferase
MRRALPAALLALAALTLLRLALAASIPLAPDEAYYFLWSRHLQPGYFDHPPMVALWIRAGTALLGTGPLGIRLLGPLSAALGSFLLWDAGEQLFPRRQAGLAAAALLNATLMLGAGAILMTPDTPLLFFWTAGLAALARLISSGNPRWWLAVGLAAGLALLSKYTAVLFIASVFLWLLTAPPGRAALRTPWPWVAVALAFLIFTPDIVWNAEHQWVSYLKQGGREFIHQLAHAQITGFLTPAHPQPPLNFGPPAAPHGFTMPRPVQFFGEFWGGQFGLFTPIIFFLVIGGLWALRRSPAPAVQAARLLLWLTLLPGAVFLEHVLKNRVQANWLAILYPSACLAAAALPAPTLRRWLNPALALGFFLTAVVYAQALTHFLPLPARADPSALQMAGWRGLGRAAAALNPPPAFLASDDYAIAAALAYYGPKNIPVAGFDDYRWAYFAFPPANLQNKTGLFITRFQPPDCIAPPATLTRRLGQQVIMRYHVCYVTAAAPGALLAGP